MEGLSVQWENVTYMCIEREKNMDAVGYLYGDNPLKHSFPVFIAMTALSQIVSHVIYFLLKPLRQPKFVCSLLGGIFLGPTVMGQSRSYLSTMFSPREYILMDVTSNLGLIYFLFLTMVKMDSPLTLRISKSAWIIGISSVVLPIIIDFSMFGLCKHLHYIMHERAHFLVFAFVLTHFPNVVHVLEELSLLSCEAGQLALTASAVNEMIAWLILPIGFIINSGNLWQASFLTFSAALLLAFFYMVRPALHWVVSRTPEGRAVDEDYIVGILLVTLLAALLTNSIGLILLGSIMFGLAIPNGPPLATTIVDKSEVFIMEFLMPFFYLYVGFHTDISSIQNWNGAFKIWLLSIFLSLCKFMGAFLPAALYYKVRIRHAVILGLLLNVRGAVELIYLRRWKERKMINGESYTVMVLANMMVTAITVPLLEILYKHRDSSSTLPVRNLTTIQKSLHGLSLRVVACVHSEQDVPSTITLLEASNPTPGSLICAYAVHLVELVGRAAPLVVPYRKHWKMLRCQSSDRIMRAFENYSRSSKGTVTIKPFTIIAPYKTMHQNIAKLAEDHSVHLIIIPFQRKQEEDVREVTFLRGLNSNIQVSAPCTVGILVDKGFGCRTRYNNFSYNVAVIFLGGPDDREALAFATRVSGREGIQMTVIRILVNCWSVKDDQEGQKKLDDTILEDFRIKNIDNARAVYLEVMAEDSVQVVNKVKSQELNYDLVIVGRRPMNSSIFTEEMLTFTENPELGVIGDMLASKDFCGHQTSILVMQHFTCSQAS